MFIHHEYNKAFALTYIATAMFNLHLVFIGIEKLWERYSSYVFYISLYGPSLTLMIHFD